MAKKQSLTVAEIQEKDYLEAAELLKSDKKRSKGLKMLAKLAKQNNAKAKFLLGFSYYYGYKDIKENKKLGNQYLVEAYNSLSTMDTNHDPIINRMLGQYYLLGMANVEEDETKAISYFEKSIALNDEDSASILANYFDKKGDTSKSETYKNIASIIHSSSREDSSIEKLVDVGVPTEEEIETIEPLIKEDKGNVDSTTVKEQVLRGDYSEISNLNNEQKYLLARSLDEESDKSEELVQKIKSLYDEVYSSLKEQGFNNDKISLRYLGEYYMYGLGSCDVNVEKALTYYDAACKSGDYESSLFLTDYYTNVERNSAKAKEYRNFGYRILGQANPDVETNEDYFETLLDEYDRNDSDFRKLISELEKNVNDEEAYKETLSKVETCARGGSIDAMLLAGYIYSTMNKFKIKDYHKALYFYKLAEVNKSVSSYYHLGKLYCESTLNDIHDEFLGLSFLRKAAKAGYPEALNYMGDLYKNGRFVNKNIDLAISFYKLAGQRGLGLAYYNLYLIQKENNNAEGAELALLKANSNGFDEKTMKQNYFRLDMLPKLKQKETQPTVEETDNIEKEEVSVEESDPSQAYLEELEQENY